MILTAFLWHMAAVTIAATVLYPTGIFPQPQVGSAPWLLSRIPWVACLTVVLAFLIMVFGGIERRSGSRSSRPAATDRATDPRPTIRPLTLTALITIGLAGILAGLLGITLADPDYHPPTGLPPAALLSYLAGAAILRWARQTT